jgi:hypothetical protein
MFAILAALIFILAAFGVTMGEVNLVALGLCTLTVHMLVGLWPLGSLKVSRKN